MNPESSCYFGLLSATRVCGSFRVSWVSEQLHCFVRLHKYPYTILNNILLKFHISVLLQGYKLLIAQSTNKHNTFIDKKPQKSILGIFKKRNMYFYWQHSIKKAAGRNKGASYILCNETNIRALVLRKETMDGSFPMAYEPIIRSTDGN